MHGNNGDIVNVSIRKDDLIFSSYMDEGGKSWFNPNKIHICNGGTMCLYFIYNINYIENEIKGLRKGTSEINAMSQ